MATQAQQTAFTQTYGPYAAQAGAKLGVSGNVILGQWAFESGWGTNRGATQLNNLAGINVPGGGGADYANYSGPQQFTDAYVGLIQNKYPQAMNVGGNSSAYVSGLKQGGYFTGDLSSYQLGVGANVSALNASGMGTGNLTASNADPNTVLPVGPDGIPTLTVRPTPSTGTGTGGVTTQGTGMAVGAGMPGVLPPVLTGGPFSVGLSPGLAAAVQGDVTSTQKTATDIASGAETATGNAFRGAFSTLVGDVQNLATRWFIIVAALVLIGVALWRLAEPQATLGSMGRRVAKAAA